MTKSSLLLILLVHALGYRIEQQQIQEPYKPLHGYNDTGNEPQPNSPDPLVRYTWDYTKVNHSVMQLYYTYKAKAVVANPPDSFSGADSIVNMDAVTEVTISESGSLMLDFGVERASWFEFTSHDLAIALSGGGVVTASISEYNQPWPGKTISVKQYGGGIYRLETNPELYEGVRFVWIHYVANDTPFHKITTWHIDQIRLASQIRPVSYTGSFHSEARIEQVWYTGAYGTRLNMHEDYFGSILMNRGDRVSIQGDGHPTMAAALVAFGSSETYDLVWKMLNMTDSGCIGCHVIDDGIMPYPVYWTMSVNDWYQASGNLTGLLHFSQDMENILDKAAATFLQRGLNIGWFGWDDRVGNGFCGSCNREAQLGFAALLVRAHHDYATTMKLAAQPVVAQKYKLIAQNLSMILRRETKLSDYGLHAGANLINSGATNPAEEDILFATQFNDTVTLCSWSNFNQYWNLQALGNMGKMDHALAMIRLCWGEQLRLGAGCFWELFSPEWNSIMKPTDKAPTRPSYCHPWSSGVTAWLTRSHLGLNPLKPGYRAYAAIPFVSKLNRGVSGSVNTPKGMITLKAYSGASHLIIVDAPVPGIIGVPKVNSDGCPLRTLRLNGQPHSHKRPPPDGISTLHQNTVRRHRYTSLLSPGFHMVHGEYTNCRNKSSTSIDGSEFDQTKAAYPPYGPAIYPTIGKFDRTTKGSWIGKYGKAGYILFAFDNGKDVSNLPSFVSSVSVFNNQSCQFSFVGRDDKNISYLEDPYTRGIRRHPSDRSRALGFVTNGGDGSQGTVLDVNVTVGTKFQIALYAVGNTRPQARSTWSARQQAIKVMDLETMNVIAPTPKMDDFDDGAYFIVQYDRGVRLRVMPINNDAGFSAVFFDRVLSVHLS